MESEYNKNSSSFWSEYITWNGLEKAAYNYHQQICKNHPVDFSISFKKSLNSDYFTCLSYNKDGLLWTLKLLMDYSNDKYLPYGIYCSNERDLIFIDDDEQIELFLNELHNLPNMTDEIYHIYFDYLKMQNKATRDYYNSLISKEELKAIHYNNSQKLPLTNEKVLKK